MEVSELEKEGFVSVAYPSELRRCVDDAMDSWKNFCALSQEEKQQLSNNDRLRDFGYMLRNDSGPRADKKELFHVSKEKMPALRERADHIEDKRALAFIDAVDALITESASVIKPFAQSVESTYGIDNFERDVMDARDRWTFRYLHYFGADTLAHPHADRGGMTLHLAETCGGGQYYTLQKEWKDWPVNRDRTIIFPSMGLQHHSSGVLKALWHRVLPLPESTFDRFALVGFIDFKQSHRYNDAAMRLQDFSPGFNYDILFAEFDKLFVPCSSARQAERAG